jgi:hypothetical protein
MSARGSGTPEQSLLKLALLGALFVLALTKLKGLNIVTTLAGALNNTKPMKTELDKPIADEVFNSLLNAGLSYQLSTYAVAQAAHETAGFNSDLFINNNNCFGMKNADLSQYRNYPTIDDSVQSFVNWFTYHRAIWSSMPYTITSIEDYVRFLKSQNYFEANEAAYLAGMKYYFNQIFA